MHVQCSMLGLTFGNMCVGVAIDDGLRRRTPPSSAAAAARRHILQHRSLCVHRPPLPPQLFASPLRYSFILGMSRLPRKQFRFTADNEGHGQGPEARHWVGWEPRAISSAQSMSFILPVGYIPSRPFNSQSFRRFPPSPPNFKVVRARGGGPSAVNILPVNIEIGGRRGGLPRRRG